MKMLYVSAGGGHMTELLEIVVPDPGISKVLVTGPDKKDMVADAEKMFDAYYALPLFSFNPLKLSVLLYRIARILIKERPDAIVSAGGQITIPFFYLGRLLFGRRVKLVFMESANQVFTPSKTGRVVYPLADLFFVQWKYLADKHYKKATYVGGLI